MAAAMQKEKSIPLSGQRLKARLLSLRQNPSLGGAALVALGTLFLLLAFPFYPLPLVPILAAIAGAIAYRYAPLGTLVGMLLAMPAVVYQSPVFGWVYLLLIAITMFEMFEHWSIISFLQIVILAPFAPYPFSFLSGFTYLAMALAALYIGSKKSILISIPAVYFVLLLSSIWMTQNSAFMPILNPQSAYGPEMEVLSHNRLPEAGFAEIFPSISGGFGRMLSESSQMMPAFGKIISNTSILILQDSAILQLASWAAVLFAIGFLPGRSANRFKQTGVCLFLFAIPLVQYLISTIYPVPFEPLSLLYVLLSVAGVAALEHYKVDFSREQTLRRAEKARKFGKFGLEDMGGGSETLGDVGGYEDVKSELKDAIITPLKKRELSLTYGLKAPKGVLLFGPPGTGKTMLMRALAKEIDYGFYYVKCSDLLSEWYGESLPYDEPILVMENGRIRLEKIGDIVEQKRQAKVLSFDAHGRVQFAEIKCHIKHRCTSPILEVRTKTGRRIRVTDYHSLFTLTENGIESIPTGRLVPKKSYIAIPSRLPPCESPVSEIDFLGALQKEDFGLFVKNGGEYLREAVKKIGAKETCETLGIKNPQYLRQLMGGRAGVRAAKFLSLMERAQIKVDKGELLVGAGKSRLGAQIPISEEFAFFLGLWVAEGSYNYAHAVRISTSEHELPAIEKICRGLFGRITIYRKGEGKGRDIYISSRTLHVLMRHVLGMKQGAREKEIPGIALSFSAQNTAAFLRGYFSGDGSVYENQKGFATVEASTASPTLASQLLYMLLYFGIVATVHPKKEWNGHISQRICFAGREQLEQFSRQIGFLDSGRNARLAAALAHGSWHRSRQIPMMEQMRRQEGLRAGGWGRCETVGADILERGGIELEEGLEEVLGGESGIYWDRVEEIKHVADEEYVYDISVDPCQNFVSGFGGIFAHNSEKNISELFSIARKNAPAILFFDEIDSIGKKRDSYSTDDVAPRIMSLLLQEMDGFGSQHNVIVIGATNVPHLLDPALLRPGRVDKIIYMHLPEKEARSAIFRVHLGKVPHSDDINFGRLSQITERYSGADIKNVCTEAVRSAAREALAKDVVVPVSMHHLTDVISKVRPSVSLDSIEEQEQFRLDFERRTGKLEQKEEEKEKPVRWSDVVGLQKVKETLLEAIEVPLLHEDLIAQFKIRPSKGLLLFGPPGCGKTMIVKAAAGELKATFITLSGADLMKKGYTGAVRIIKESFNRAREQAPSLIFIDEIEALAPEREIYGGNVVSQILTEMDGMRELKGVMLVGATNRPQMLDSAMLRPGRFDKIIYIPPPDLPARAEIFRQNLGDTGKSLDFAELARASEGFSGADIASICQEAKMSVVREKIKGREKSLSSGDILQVIRSRKPSVTRSSLAEFSRFLEEYGERK